MLNAPSVSRTGLTTKRSSVGLARGAQAATTASRGPGMHASGAVLQVTSIMTFIVIARSRSANSRAAGASPKL